jgi:hypothetical protein
VVCTAVIHGDPEGATRALARRTRFAFASAAFGISAAALVAMLRG